jgi:hypothetical protein
VLDLEYVKKFEICLNKKFRKYLEMSMDKIELRVRNFKNLLIELNCLSESKGRKKGIHDSQINKRFQIANGFGNNSVQRIFAQRTSDEF